nr:DUF4132 domain-containing protein [Kibdelosporangium sp. MJ126-NF4]
MSEDDRAEWQEHQDRAGDLVFRGEHGPHWWPDERVAELSPERLGSMLMLTVRMFVGTTGLSGWALRESVAGLLRRPLSVTDDDALLAARTAVRAVRNWQAVVPLRIAEVMLRQRFGPVITDEAASDAARAMIDFIAGDQSLASEGSSLRARLRKMLPVEGLDLSVIARGDGWAEAVLPRLTDGSHDTEAAAMVLSQLASATGSKPTKGWASETARLLESESAVAVLRLLVERLVDAPPLVVNGYYDVVLKDGNGDLVRAALWATTSQAASWVVPALSAIATRSGNIESQKVRNAAIYALGRLGAVRELSALDAKTRDNGVRKRIAAALTDAGAAQGLSPSQVLERMVDDGGLGEDGAVEFTSGSVTARATLTADLSVTVAWRGPTDWGKKPPAEAETTDVNAIKRRVTELRRLVAQERRRVEGLFAEDRGWDMADWRRYYLDHPITGRIAARLLWRFGDVTKLGADADLPADGPVRLWHPARASLDEVTAWRDWLVDHELRQPFKQAYREVYLLTDAERGTGTYSNRFAAHVLHYNQAFALFKERGWGANYLGPYDGGYEGHARREFRDAGITAVFTHFAVDQVQDGSPNLCTTDRVWFHRTAGRAKTPLPLDEVPPLVFCEAMRDVDLFVGVASIALDPNWADRGDDPHLGYWHQVSFGELTARAQIRREVLARILPKLSVAGRVELADRHVLVHGRLADYKIHLGSANILIQPGDRYLCIVPRSGMGKKVMLPFDGDDVLSVILSKIALLAADHRITDTSILNQIGSAG